MKLGFLYAGQGSQHAGMGADLYEAFSAFRAVYDHAEVDFDLKKVTFEDPDGIINQTRYTQPLSLIHISLKKASFSMAASPLSRALPAWRESVGCHSAPMAKVSSAVQASSPLTVALHSPMPTGPRRLVRTHSISSTSPGITFRRKRAFFTPPNRAILPWFSGRERMATAPTWALSLIHI